jgi:hypothetical protein
MLIAEVSAAAMLVAIVHPSADVGEPAIDGR